jgi:hypothetical protein
VLLELDASLSHTSMQELGQDTIIIAIEKEKKKHSVNNITIIDESLMKK